ncbi:DHH family phosphoesterase [Candidatus Woesearchaeota archaeon]|nr:DHH family phosphoesterase [Candidatus Woesearchaeota archaeon]
MIPENVLQEIRGLLQKSQSPIFFFDDDCDGVCSYLVLLNYCKKGYGVAIKNAPELGEIYLSKVQEIQPDLVVILDKPLVDQSFLDHVSVPVLWLDHHPPVTRNKVHYYNPHLYGSGDGYSTTRIAYEVTQETLWVAAVGSVADWTLPPFLDSFNTHYPEILSQDYKDPGDLLFKSKIGFLVKLFYFSLKGTTTDVRRNMKLLSTVESPFEILNETSDAGRQLVERTKSNFSEYNRLLEKAKKNADEEPVLLFLYPSTKNSYTGMLANELIYLYPDKVIIVGREKSGEIRMSLRSQNYILPPILEKAFVGLKGYGGGHDHACGAAVSKHDFERFLEQLRNELH